MKSYKDFFDDHLVTLTRADDQVTFVSDGRFGLQDDHEWKITFRVGVGDTFKKAPDRHEQCDFKVLEILDAGVKIEYVSKFDHRSFGRNIVSVDSGIVILKYLLQT